jgi:cyanophycin synthetase
VTIRDGEILLVNGADELPVVKLVDIPLASSENASPAVENILAAVATAWALGISPALISTGIENIAGVSDGSQPASETRPSRFQIERETLGEF